MTTFPTTSINPRHLALTQRTSEHLDNQNDKSILALDIKGALNNIFHDTIYAGWLQHRVANTPITMYPHSALTALPQYALATFAPSPPRQHSKVPHRAQSYSPCLLNIPMKALQTLKHTQNICQTTRRWGPHTRRSSRRKTDRPSTPAMLSSRTCPE